MPNWCKVEMTIFGPAGDLDRFEKQAEGVVPATAFEPSKATPLAFKSFVPQPEDSRTDTTIEKNGFPRCQNWREQHWGTAWEPIEVEKTRQASCLHFTFLTGWTPPIALVERLAAMYPALDFDLRYEEHNMQIQGRVVAREGVMA